MDTDRARIDPPRCAVPRCGSAGCGNRPALSLTQPSRKVIHTAEKICRGWFVVADALSRFASTGAIRPACRWPTRPPVGRASGRRCQWLTRCRHRRTTNTTPSGQRGWRSVCSLRFAEGGGQMADIEQIAAGVAAGTDADCSHAPSCAVTSRSSRPCSPRLGSSVSTHPDGR